MESTTRPKDTEQRYQADVDPTLDSLQLLLREAGRFQLLTPAEEIELAKRIEKGDLDAKDRMINSNLRLVVPTRAATRARASPLGDLIQEGMLGLIRAVEKFDWRKGFRFSTYATLWIRQAIQRGLENTSRTIRLPVHVAQRSRKVGRIERELTTEARPRADHGRGDRRRGGPAAGRRDRDPQGGPRGRQPRQAGRRRRGHLVRRPARAGDGAGRRRGPGEAPLGDAPDRDRRAPEEPERNVIEMRFGAGDQEPQTLSQAGKKLGVSTERARQLEERALRQLSQRPELIALREAA